MYCGFCNGATSAGCQYCNIGASHTNQNYKPVAFITDDYHNRYLNPPQDKVAIFSVREATIVLNFLVPNLQVWAIDERTMRVAIIQNVSEAISFYGKYENV